MDLAHTLHFCSTDRLFKLLLCHWLVMFQSVRDALISVGGYSFERRHESAVSCRKSEQPVSVRPGTYVFGWPLGWVD